MIITESWRIYFSGSSWKLGVSGHEQIQSLSAIGPDIDVESSEHSWIMETKPKNKNKVTAITIAGLSML